jgi:hypothetical protein
LKANLRVRFEGEECMGNGLVGEFLLCAVNIIGEGIEKGDKNYFFRKVINYSNKITI